VSPNRRHDLSPQPRAAASSPGWHTADASLQPGSGENCGLGSMAISTRGWRPGGGSAARGCRLNPRSWFVHLTHPLPHRGPGINRSSGSHAPWRWAFGLRLARLKRPKYREDLLAADEDLIDVREHLGHAPETRHHGGRQAALSYLPSAEPSRKRPYTCHPSFRV